MPNCCQRGTRDAYESIATAGRHQGLVPYAHCGLGGRRNRLRPRTVERPRCGVIGDLSLLDTPSDCASLHGLVRIQAERYHKASGKTERQIRYNITSLKPDAALLNRTARQHWRIENKLHWALDVGFGGDASRAPVGHAAQNFSVLNRIAHNMLKQDKSCKAGVHGKRLQAARDHQYLLKLLGGFYMRLPQPGMHQHRKTS
jgi:predicted transposase YbfD/YdcC